MKTKKRLISIFRRFVLALGLWSLGCGALKTDLENYCNAVERSGVKEPREDMKTVRLWLTQTITSSSGKKLYAMMHQLTPGREAYLLKGAAADEGIRICPFADFLAKMEASPALPSDNDADEVDLMMLALDCSDPKRLVESAKIIIESKEAAPSFSGDYRFEQALVYFKKACDCDYAVGCQHVVKLSELELGVAYDKAVVDQYHEKGKELNRKGCDQKDGEACAHLAMQLALETEDRHDRHARNLARAFGAVAGEPPTEPKITGKMKSFYKKALTYSKADCDSQKVNQALACHIAGVLIHQGMGGPKNEKKGHEFTKKACDLGRALDCDDLGLHDEARKLYDVQCEKGDASACMITASLWTQGKVLGPEEEGKREWDMAKKCWRMACKLGHRLGCRNVSNLK